MNDQLTDASARRRAFSALLVLVAPVLGASFVSKLAIPGMPVDGIGLGFPLIYVALLWGLYIGDIVALEWSRLMAFCLMAGVLGAASLINVESVSVPSIAMLMVLHLPYVFHIRCSEKTRGDVLRTLLNVALIIALCGLFQFAMQSFAYGALPTGWLYPIENLLPASWRVTGFNMQIPLSYGSTVYRANGIFMQEPSFYSQFLAIAVLAELVSFNRMWRVLLLMIAIVVAQSGTGLILLGVCLPLLVIAYRRGDLLVGGLIVLGILALSGPLLHVDNLIGRIGEFSSTKSSAYERFVGGFHVFDVALAEAPMRAMFGFGAGTYREVVQSLGHPAAEMALFKMVMEFGVIGALSYFGFIFYCFFSARGPFVLRLCLALSLFLNGAYNTFVHSLALSLLVWGSTSNELAAPQWLRTWREKRVHDETSPNAYGPLAGGSI